MTIFKRSANLTQVAILKYYRNFLCPDLAHAAGDELIARCMRESVETLSNTSKSSTYALPYLLTHAGSMRPGWISEGPRGAKMAKYRAK